MYEFFSKYNNEDVNNPYLRARIDYHCIKTCNSADFFKNFVKYVDLTKITRCSEDQITTFINDINCIREKLIKVRRIDLDSFLTEFQCAVNNLRYFKLQEIFNLIFKNDTLSNYLIFVSQPRGRNVPKRSLDNQVKIEGISTEVLKNIGEVYFNNAWDYFVNKFESSNGKELVIKIANFLRGIDRSLNSSTSLFSGPCLPQEMDYLKEHNEMSNKIVADLRLMAKEPCLKGLLELYIFATKHKLELKKISDKANTLDRANLIETFKVSFAFTKQLRDFYHKLQDNNKQDFSVNIILMCQQLETEIVALSENLKLSNHLMFSKIVNLNSKINSAQAQTIFNVNLVSKEIESIRINIYEKIFCEIVGAKDIENLHYFTTEINTFDLGLSSKIFKIIFGESKVKILINKDVATIKQLKEFLIEHFKLEVDMRSIELSTNKLILEGASFPVDDREILLTIKEPLNYYERLLKIPGVDLTPISLKLDQYIYAIHNLHDFKHLFPEDFCFSRPSTQIFDDLRVFYGSFFIKKLTNGVMLLQNTITNCKAVSCDDTAVNKNLTEYVNYLQNTLEMCISEIKDFSFYAVNVAFYKQLYIALAYAAFSAEQLNGCEVVLGKAEGSQLVGNCFKAIERLKNVYDYILNAKDFEKEEARNIKSNCVKKIFSAYRIVVFALDKYCKALESNKTLRV